jgi:hypothetical protein
MSNNPFEEKFGVTLDEIAQAVRNGCGRISGIDVDEVLSKVWLYFTERLARRPESIKSKPDLLKLLRINAKHQAFAILKAARKSRGVPVDLDVIAAGGSGHAEAPPLPVKSCDEAAALLTMLDADTREIFRRLCNGDSIETVMSEFGVSNPTVRRRNYAARAVLRRLISMEPEPRGDR